MIPSLVLGLVGGFAAVRLVSRVKHGCASRCGGGACGGGAFYHGGVPRKLFWLGRYLDLDPRQMAEVGDLFHKVRASAGNLHAGKREGLAALFDAFGAENFDRGKVEAAAGRQGEALGQVKKDFVDALERLHQVLTPAQRDRLRSLLGGYGRWGRGFGGGGFAAF